MSLDCLKELIVYQQRWKITNEKQQFDPVLTVKNHCSYFVCWSSKTNQGLSIYYVFMTPTPCDPADFLGVKSGPNWIYKLSIPVLDSGGARGPVIRHHCVAFEEKQPLTSLKSIKLKTAWMWFLLQRHLQVYVYDANCAFTPPSLKGCCLMCLLTDTCFEGTSSSVI